jgi:hypothetical protein
MTYTINFFIAITVLWLFMINRHIVDGFHDGGITLQVLFYKKCQLTSPTPAMMIVDWHR